MLATKKKQAVIKKHQIHDKDTGSTVVQVVILNKGSVAADGTMADILALHTGSEDRGGAFSGGRLEEVFMKLISNKENV
jgi:hypothetical protein